jgi:hypothetical protein
MKTKTGFRTKFSFKLTKWDGEEPKDCDNPEAHPRCVEVLEWDLGEKARVTHRRESWQAD